MKALGATKEAGTQAATGLADWFQEWSRQHDARAKLARDAAGRLRGVSGRLYDDPANSETGPGFVLGPFFCRIGLRD